MNGVGGASRIGRSAAEAAAAASDKPATPVRRLSTHFLMTVTPWCEDSQGKLTLMTQRNAMAKVQHPVILEIFKWQKSSITFSIVNIFCSTRK
jgi:hypothetical protein